jgi:4-amino-4-deoxy-L-arabinose transferase-like glycosyltransferase
MSDNTAARYKIIKRKITTPAGIAVLFFCLAAVLRLSLVTVAYYGAVGELYRDLEVVWRLFHFHDWPLLGPSSALGGFYFGALYYYIEAVFVRAANFAPYGATLASSFFSLLSLPMLYALCKRWFLDPWVAALAVVIQSMALFDIQNAYYLSNPNLLPFFVLAFLYLLTLVVEGKKSLFAYALLGLAAGIAAQLHATALVLLPVILIWVFYRYRIWPNLTRAAAFCLFFLLPAAPYIIYNFQHGFGVFFALLNIGQHQAIFGSRWLIIAGIFNFFGSFFIFKDGFFNFYPGYTAWFAVAAALAVFVTVLAIWAWQKSGFVFSRTGISDAGYSLLAAWLGFGLLMYIIFAVPPAYYYFIIMWPLPVIAAAWWLCALRKVSVKYFWATLGSYAALQLLCIAVFFAAIYQPQYSYGNLQQLFGGLKQASAGQNYVVVNEALELNQFYYYLRLNGIPQRQKSGTGYTLYDIVDCPKGLNSLPTAAVVGNYREICLTGRQK